MQREQHRTLTLLCTFRGGGDGLPQREESGIALNKEGLSGAVVLDHYLERRRRGREALRMRVAVDLWLVSRKEYVSPGADVI